MYRWWAANGVARAGSLQGMATRGNGQEQEQRDEDLQTYQ